MQGYTPAGMAKSGLVQRLTKLLCGLSTAVLIEIGIRVLLAAVFAVLQHVPPRARLIHPEELWLYRNHPSAPYIPSWWVVVMATLAVPSVLLLLLLLDSPRCQTESLQNPSAIPFSHHPLGSRSRDLGAPATLLSYSLSLLLTGVITDLVKLMVGRPRPDFYYRCQPAPDASNSDASASGDGSEDQPPPQASVELIPPPSALLPSACTGDASAVAEGRKSFPSGHASMSFACLAYLSLYLAARLRLFSSSSSAAASSSASSSFPPSSAASSWRLLVCLSPLLLAACIGLSRLADFHHHAEDVFAGSALGFALAWLCFRAYHPPASLQQQQQQHPFGAANSSRRIIEDV